MREGIDRPVGDEADARVVPVKREIYEGPQGEVLQIGGVGGRGVAEEDGGGGGVGEGAAGWGVVLREAEEGGEGGGGGRVGEGGEEESAVGRRRCRRNLPIDAVGMDKGAEGVVGDERGVGREGEVGDRTGVVAGVDPPLDGGAVERVAGDDDHRVGH